MWPLTLRNEAALEVHSRNLEGAAFLSLLFVSAEVDLSIGIHARVARVIENSDYG